jgi:NAD/NADP transhydrogenase beta subunit
MNIYVKSLVYGVIGTSLAYVLNLIFKYTDNSVAVWSLTLVAFIIGNYIGIRIREKRNKSEKTEE